MLFGLSGQEERDDWGFLACIGERMLHAGFWWGNLRGSDHFKELGIDERIILKWIFKKLLGWMGTGFI